MRNKILMTLALLLTAVGGAWATEYNIKQMQVGDVIQVGDVLTIPNDGATEAAVIYEGKQLWLSVGDTRSWTLKRGTADKTTSYPETSVVAADGEDFVFDNGTNVKGRTEFYSPSVTYGSIPYNDSGLKVTATDFSDDIAPKITVEAAAPALEVTWTPATKTGYFTMPTYDVELTPVYAPAAQWALVETVKQLPAAAEGVIAGTDAPLIVEGIVAFAGTSTEVTQGIVMYAVTSTNQAKAPELSAFSATLPTAKDIADEGAEVLVWYYIKGADTPQGQTATAENTFNDSEICETPIKVTVLSNKFDIEFKAANANTIEAGKATVTVGGTDATVTEGKLESVKMGSEVKIKAVDGYKFRKVEVKKGGSAVLAPALENGATVVIICNWGYSTTTFTYTNNGGTFSGQASGYEAGYFNNGLELNGKNLSFSAWNVDNSEFLSVGITFNTESSAYSYTGKGEDFSSFTISVNGTDVTDQLSELK